MYGERRYSFVFKWLLPTIKKMISVLSFILVVQSVQLVQGAYTINQFKYEFFESYQIDSFRAFENQNLDENFFRNDYTKAPRRYNTSKCIDDLLSIQKKLQIGDRESMMCKIDFHIIQYWIVSRFFS